MNQENSEGVKKSPAGNERIEGVAALIARLPQAYAAWEADIASGEINQVQARVEALLKPKESETPPRGDTPLG